MSAEPQSLAGKVCVVTGGLDLTWALNLPAPFLLTHLLLDRLKASGPALVGHLPRDDRPLSG